MSNDDYKRNKEPNKKLTFFITFIISIGIFTVGGLFLLYKVDSVGWTKSDEDLGIMENDDNEGFTDNRTINIAVFGLDDDEGTGIARSDSIMIASIDKRHKKLKLTSIMRDTYVEIEEHGMDKIGHAYAFGGPELAVKTINQNFNMNIRDYVSIDFLGFKKIINAMDGVEIDVELIEVPYVKVDEPGLQILDGQQALDYSRIRKIGNGDYERTERQRLVLETMMKKAMNLNITQYPKLVSETLPYVNTSLSKMDIVGLGTKVVTSGIKDIDQFRIPVDEHVEHEMIDGIFYMIPRDLDDNIFIFKRYIYDDIK